MYANPTEILRLIAAVRKADALREALEGLDEPIQWLADHYPKAFVEMPTRHMLALTRAGAALSATEPAE